MIPITGSKVHVGCDAAREARAVVVLKGARTYITTPDHQTYSYGEGRIGLATSGSGDTLGGAIAGLLARGATAPRTAVWGVYLHGQAGATLTDRLGKPGLLERR